MKYNPIKQLMWNQKVGSFNRNDWSLHIDAKTVRRELIPIRNAPKTNFKILN